MKFEMVPLGTVSEVTKLAGFEYSKYFTYDDSGEIIALRALNLRHGELDLTEVKRISRSISEELPRSRLYNGDIVLTYTGNGYGDCAIITDDNRFHLAPNICKISSRRDLIEPYFLYSYMRSEEFYQSMRNHVVGSSQPTIPMKTIRLLPVPLPPKEVQKKIIGIVSAFDKKIRTDKRINKNLEQQAQAIFRDSFLRHKKLPDGWCISCLSDIANYTNGLAMQKYRPMADEAGLPVLKIRELRQGSVDNSTERCSLSIKPEYIVHDGDVVFSWSGSLLVDFWCGGTCGLNQHLFKVTSEKYDKWFYYAWTQFHLEQFIAVAADKATTMGHIKRTELDRATVFIPSKSDYTAIGGILSPIYDTIIKNRLESRKLMELRDMLLPKLMSGEIDVSNLNL